MNKKITNFLIMMYILIELISYLNFNLFILFNKINIIFSFFVFFTIYIGNAKKMDVKLLYYTIFIFVLLLFAIFINNGAFGSVLNIVCMMFGFQVFSKIEISNFSKKSIIFFLIVVLIFNIFKSLNVYNTTLYYNNTDFNSNTVAECILYINIILFLTINDKRKHYILTILLIAISLFGIINTQSRGAILSYLFFLLLYFLKKIKIIKNKTNVILLILIIAGTIFPIIYLNMYKNGTSFSIPYMNKSLYTGREELWLYSYECLTQNKLNIFVGLGSNFSIIGQKTLNLHNMFLALIINFGVIVFLLIMMWLIKFVKDNIDKEKLYVLTPIVVLSFFETTILWNAILVYIFLIVNIIAKRNSEN